MEKRISKGDVVWCSFGSLMATVKKMRESLQKREREGERRGSQNGKRKKSSYKMKNGIIVIHE